MRAKQRYLLAATCVAFLGLCYFGGHRIKPRVGREARDPVVAAASANSNKWRERRKHFVSRAADHVTPDWPLTAFPSSERNQFVRNVSSSSSTTRAPPPAIRPCRMETCFDFSRCPERPFRHYVYPTDDRATMTDSYRKLLEVLRSSPLYTDDPSRACLFVLSLDTLDRDPDLNKNERYVHNLQAQLDQLELWNGGENHVVFNLYSGNFVNNYDERDIGFDLGKAILVRNCCGCKRMDNSISHKSIEDSKLTLMNLSTRRRPRQASQWTPTGPGLTSRCRCFTPLCR